MKRDSSRIEVEIKFTSSEQELIKLISRGILTSKKLAEKRQVSVTTIEHNLTIIKGKMHVETRLELAFALIQANLLVPDDKKENYHRLVLTNKEKEVLKILIKLNRNFSYQGCAKELGIAEATLKKYLKSIRSKLHCNNLPELVIKIYQKNLVEYLNIKS